MILEMTIAMILGFSGTVLLFAIVGPLMVGGLHYYDDREIIEKRLRKLEK